MPKRDIFAECFGDVVRDVREKLVEEPWFGRAMDDPKPPEPGSLAEMFGWERRGAEVGDPGREHGYGHEHDIDR